MSSSTRTVRFSAAEAKRIEEFLQQNTFLDFSSLARLAISKFIENPSVTIQGISYKNVKNSPRSISKEQNGSHNG